MEEKNNDKNPATGAAAKSEPGDIGEKLAKAEKDRDDYLAGWQRAKADFINYKNDELKRLEEVARYGSVELIRDVIATLDSFDLGLRAMEKAGPLENGIYMIRAQIEDILKKRGVEKIAVKIGDKFDPALAEAVAETESEKPAGTILEEIEPGYRLYDKILRPARVKVSKQKSENNK